MLGACRIYFANEGKEVKMKKKKFEKYLLMNWKHFWTIVASWFASVILHNLFYAVFGGEEAVFFILATIIIPIYFIFSLIYTIVYKIKKRKK